LGQRAPLTEALAVEAMGPEAEAWQDTLKQEPNKAAAEEAVAAAAELAAALPVAAELLLRWQAAAEGIAAGEAQVAAAAEPADLRDQAWQNFQEESSPPHSVVLPVLNFHSLNLHLQSSAAS